MTSPKRRAADRRARSARERAAAALREGTDAHYLDPRIYDHAYGSRRHDVRFYVSIAGELGGPILELGAGSGRVTLALARAGHEVVAVDRMPSMLDRLRERVEKLPTDVGARIVPIEGDFASLRLRRRFPLVIAPFNVFMHLYTRLDVERALDTVRAHLVPKTGRLVFDVMMPEMVAIARSTGGLDRLTQIRTMTSVMRNPGDPSELRELALAQRQFFPAELEALLHYNGFDTIERWGGFNRGPLGSASESQVIVARSTRRR